MIMTEQEKKEFQALKDRVASLEYLLSVLQGQKGIPTAVPIMSNPKYGVTC